MPLTSVSNKVDGVAGWDKSVVDVNNIDESYANARDLGYSRLNNTRISVIGRLGQYDDKDMYKFQVQSNGKLFISLRSGDGDEDKKVLDLSEYDKKLSEIKSDMADLGIEEEKDPLDTIVKQPIDFAKDEVKRQKERRERENRGLLDDVAPGMTIKVYAQNGKNISCVGDSTAKKSSKEYKNMEAIMNGDYKAKKAMYYVEISYDNDIKEDKPYVMQIKQGDKYINDYLVSEGKSEDSKNETISLTSSTSSSEQISSAYAAQIQAQRFEATSNMMIDSYQNMSKIKNKMSNSQKMFSSLINTNA